MKNKCLLTNSINKFNNVGVNFLKKDDQFGESNTIIIENIISGIDKRDYYFQTRKINNTYICIVTKLIISDQIREKKIPINFQVKFIFRRIYLDFYFLFQMQ